MIILKNEKFLWVDIQEWRATSGEPGLDAGEHGKCQISFGDGLECLGCKAWDREPGMEDMAWRAWDGESGMESLI